MIEKLTSHNVTYEVFVDKLNEVIDVLNNITEPKPDPYAQMHQTGRRYVFEFNQGLVGLNDLLNRWNVAFYDDVVPRLESPVYCRNCQFQSQSLLDRMHLDPNDLCKGCIEKSKWG